LGEEENAVTTTGKKANLYIRQAGRIDLWPKAAGGVRLVGGNVSHKEQKMEERGGRKGGDYTS